MSGPPLFWGRFCPPAKKAAAKDAERSAQPRMAGRFEWYCQKGVTREYHYRLSWRMSSPKKVRIWYSPSMRERMAAP